MAQVKVTEGFDPLPSGVYQAVITAVTEVESSFNPDSGALRWEFTVSDGDHAGYELWQFSSARLGPKCKARVWLTQLGIELRKDVVFDFDHVVGIPVRLLVTREVKKDGTGDVNVVVEMRRIAVPAGEMPVPTTATATVGAVAVEAMPF